MHAVIVFNHPYSGSFCNAVLHATVEGLQRGSHTADVIHLDNDRFNPVMTAADLKAFVDRCPVDPQAIAYKARLEAADHLIFIFPIWWELMPAMMKGFIDKVFFPGIAYDYKSNGFMKRRLTRVKGVTLITTMNTASFVYRLVFGNAIKKAFFTGTFWKTGYSNRKWINLNMVKMVSDQKRRKWLAGIGERFARLK